MIEQCKERSIQPCSVDLRLGRVYKIVGKGVIDFEKNMPKSKEIKMPYILKPGEYVLASTIEKLNQKYTKYAGLIIPRSRAFRVGLSIEGGLIYPYYQGEIVFGIRNISKQNILLKEGLSIIQICFFEIKSDFVPLKHKYQNGKII